jgi:integrase/recombinase XerD
MSVILREKKKKNGKSSLFLDINYKGKRDKIYLGMSLVPENNRNDREHNKRIKQRAQELLLYKQLELTEGKYTPMSIKKEIDVLDYFDNKVTSYEKGDKRNIEGSVRNFSKYLQTLYMKSITFDKLDYDLVEGYAEYLFKNCIGEGGRSYFNRFKKLLKMADREGLVVFRDFKDIKVRVKDSKPKDVLTNEEIIQLLTHHSDSEICRSFVFSCLTGLGNAEIRNLKWKDINTKEQVLNVVRFKNGRTGQIPLHENALVLLQGPKDDDRSVFDLPSDTTINKQLKKMVESSGITKHITFYCGRHTFGTNTYESTSDINIVAELLLHSSLKYVKRYSRTSVKKKREAVDSTFNNYGFTRFIDIGRTVEQEVLEN